MYNMCRKHWTAEKSASGPGKAEAKADSRLTQTELAATAAAVVIVVAATAAAAAAAENEDENDDPAAVSVTKKVAHIVCLLSSTLHIIAKKNICYKLLFCAAFGCQKADVGYFRKSQN